MTNVIRGLFDTPPAARNTDPDTSHGAKEFNLNEDRVLVWSIHVKHRNSSGLTDYELADITGKQQNSVAVRRGELRDHCAWIVDTGDKRPGPTRAKCIVWKITPLGLVDWEFFQLFGLEALKKRIEKYVYVRNRKP